MKTLALITAFAVAASPVASLVTTIHPCPLFIPAGFPNPFAATAAAVNGTYLEAKDEIGILAPGPNDAAFTYGSASGPIGLWGAGPTSNGCPGYAYLNAVAKTSAYSILTWNATSTTNWNSTVGSYLTKLGGTSSSDFIACRKTTTSDSTWALLLRTASILPATVESAEGDLIATTACVPTKILVTHAPGFQVSK